jgi:hypothetical protein
MFGASGCKAYLQSFDWCSWKRPSSGMLVDEAGAAATALALAGSPALLSAQLPAVVPMHCSDGVPPSCRPCLLQSHWRRPQSHSPRIHACSACTSRIQGVRLLQVSDERPQSHSKASLTRATRLLPSTCQAGRVDPPPLRIRAVVVSHEANRLRQRRGSICGGLCRGAVLHEKGFERCAVRADS